VQPDSRRPAVPPYPPPVASNTRTALGQSRCGICHQPIGRGEKIADVAGVTQPCHVWPCVVDLSHGT
jgi:hypothetical protein